MRYRVLWAISELFFSQEFFLLEMPEIQSIFITDAATPVRPKLGRVLIRSIPFNLMHTRCFTEQTSARRESEHREHCKEFRASEGQDYRFSGSRLSDWSSFEWKNVGALNSLCSRE